jgi:hypothetical protein
MAFDLARAESISPLFFFILPFWTVAAINFAAKPEEYYLEDTIRQTWKCCRINRREYLRIGPR